MPPFAALDTAHYTYDADYFHVTRHRIAVLPRIVFSPRFLLFLYAMLPPPSTAPFHYFAAAAIISLPPLHMMIIDYIDYHIISHNGYH